MHTHGAGFAHQHMMAEPLHFHDETTLLDRLSKGLQRRSQEVIFLVGAPLNCPLRPGMAGVPGVDGVIELIRQEFHNDPSQLLGTRPCARVRIRKTLPVSFSVPSGS